MAVTAGSDRGSDEPPGHEPASGRSNGIQSVERTFAVLDVMAAAGGEASLSELAAGSELPLPTIHRIVRTLAASGHIRQHPDRRYALGPRLITLGEAASRMLGSWARPHLTELAENAGETANMAVLDRDRAVYVAQVPSRHSMRMFTEVGRRVRLHCTGVGKALLAQLPEARVRELLTRSGMPAETSLTITDVEALIIELDHIRRRGHAIDDGEQENGVRCIAIPVPGAVTPTSISVSGPETRMTSAEIDRVLPHALAAARHISSKITSPSNP